MWRYSNPVAITFGADAFAELPKLVAGQPYALVTYPDAPFVALAERLRHAAGEPVVTISDVAPNPDTRLLAEQSARFGAVDEPKVIVALGGGSVIDTAKVLAAARARLCGRTPLSDGGHRRRDAFRNADHRGTDDGGHRKRGHLMGDRVGYAVGQEIFALAPEPLSKTCAGRSEADDRKAAPAHDQHRARRAFACARKSVERECESRLGAPCGRGGARNHHRPASTRERPAEPGAAQPDGRGSAVSRPRLLQHPNRDRTLDLLSGDPSS